MALEIRERWLLTAAAGVVLWRVVALPFPHPQFDGSLALRSAMTLLGLWCLACGLWAFHKAPGRASFVFALFGLTSGLHWGGPFGVGAADADTFLLAFYLVVSSIAGQTLYLHVALAFAPALRPHRFALTILYLPTLLGAVGAALLLLPGTSSAAESLLGLLLLVGTLLSVVGVVVWITRFIRDPHRRTLRWVGVGLALDVGIEAGGMAGLPVDDWFHLGFAFFPAALAAALVARHADRNTGPATA